MVKSIDHPGWIVDVVFTWSSMFFVRTENLSLDQQLLMLLSCSLYHCSFLRSSSIVKISRRVGFDSSSSFPTGSHPHSSWSLVVSARMKKSPFATNSQLNSVFSMMKLVLFVRQIWKWLISLTRNQLPGTHWLIILLEKWNSFDLHYCKHSCRCQQWEAPRLSIGRKDCIITSLQYRWW